MSMTTQCPACSTKFRVTPQQLRAQNGSVRCGRCALVFDGFKTLATLPDAPPVPTPPAAAASGERARAPASGHAPAAEPARPRRMVPPPPLPQPESAPTPPEAVPAAVVTPAAAAPVAPAPPVPAAPAVAVAPPVIAAPPSAVAPPVAAEAPAEPVPPPLPAAVGGAAGDAAVATERPMPPTRRRAGAIWGLGSLLLAGTLAAQYAYFHRGDIAAAAPDLRPRLVEWCRLLACTVDLPQRPRQISIEASDMQAADTANPGLVILTATLRNQAGVTLGFPALDVVLTNTREHTVARRIFLPAEYLAGSRDWRAGLPPSAEVTIRLNLDSGDLGAAGFRLDLMAAPAG